MIKAVILDMDGTMFDTEEATIQAFLKIRQELGVPGKREFYLQTIGGSSDGSGEQRMRRELGDQYDRYQPLAREAFLRIHREEPPAKPGLYELLEYLKKHGYRMAVATSTPREVAEPTLINGKVLSYLDAVIFGDMIEKGRGKPNPDIFLRACEALGVAPEETMGLEDSYNGVRGLHAAGIYTVMIPDLLPCTPEIEPLLDRKLSTLEEVIPLLEELSRA